MKPKKEVSKQMKIYHVYAERHLGEYGREEFGYYTSRKKAEKAKSDGMKKARQDRRNGYGFKVDGYFEEDWNIDEIDVE